MNPVTKHLQRHKSREVYALTKPFSFQETYGPIAAHYGSDAHEYNFEARFGMKHIISDEVANNAKENTLAMVQREVARELTEHIYGPYIARLYLLRTKLLAKGEHMLAADVSAIIADITEL